MAANKRDGVPGWWDMPRLSGGELPMAVWGPIVGPRIRQIREGLFQAWRRYRRDVMAAGSGAMTVGEYAAWLLATFDPALPIHKDVGAAEFAPLTLEGVSSNVVARPVMKARNEEFYALATADIWKNARDQFGPDFDAVILS